ncbi:MAG: twin-arginine translocase subunit TatC [Betaproteobacteria bacterium]|nr:twin-arginine translocase subunit TatC [Betaproteobacteria bacterium]
MMSTQETFISHLVELRQRLIRAFTVVIVLFFGLFFWASDIYDLLAYPMIKVLPEGTKMIATGVITPFLVPVKVTMLVAFVIALPYVLYQVWAFVAPGLYQHEKKLVFPLVIGSTTLFLIGMAFCYFVVFGAVFNFVYSWAPKSITVAPDIEQYLSFAITMFMVFGITFEVPMVVIILVYMGICTVQQLRQIRPYFIVGAFIVAAVVTPPDVLSQILLAVPLCILYELGIIVANILVKPGGRAPLAADQSEP